MNIMNRNVADVVIHRSNDANDILFDITSVKNIELFNINGKCKVVFTSALSPAGINKNLSLVKPDSGCYAVLKWEAINVETGDTVRYRDVIRLHSISLKTEASCEGAPIDYQWEIRGEITV